MASPTDDSTDLFVAEARASGIDNIRNVTDSALVWEADPTWLPDGSAILVHRSYLSDEEPELVAIRPDGSLAEGLLSRLEMRGAYYVRLSPAGDKVAFAVADLPALLLYVADLDGTYLLQVTQSGWVGRAAFTPGGDLLAYCWSLDGTSRGGQLMVADLTVQSPPAVIVADAPGCSSPAWSPDGEWIAFAALDRPLSRIQIVRPDGTDRMIVETGPNDAGSPGWRRLPSEP
jgi:TolB protein